MASWPTGPKHRTNGAFSNTPFPTLLALLLLAVCGLVAASFPLLAVAAEMGPFDGLVPSHEANGDGDGETLYSSFDQPEFSEPVYSDSEETYARIRFQNQNQPPSVSGENDDVAGGYYSLVDEPPSLDDESSTDVEWFALALDSAPSPDSDPFSADGSNGAALIESLAFIMSSMQPLIQDATPSSYDPMEDELLYLSELVDAPRGSLRGRAGPAFVRMYGDEMLPPSPVDSFFKAMFEDSVGPGYGPGYGPGPGMGAGFSPLNDGFRLPRPLLEPSFRPNGYYPSRPRGFGNVISLTTPSPSSVFDSPFISVSAMPLQMAMPMASITVVTIASEEEDLDTSGPVCEMEQAQFCGHVTASDATSLLFNMMMCLRDHLPELSDTCQEFLNSGSSVDRDCYSDIRAHCETVKPGNGAIHQCLARTSPDSLTSACQAYMSTHKDLVRAPIAVPSSPRTEAKVDDKAKTHGQPEAGALLDPMTAAMNAATANRVERTRTPAELRRAMPPLQAAHSRTTPSSGANHTVVAGIAAGCAVGFFAFVAVVAYIRRRSANVSDPNDHVYSAMMT